MPHPSNEGAEGPTQKAESLDDVASALTYYLLSLRGSPSRSPADAKRAYEVYSQRAWTFIRRTLAATGTST